ncbi:Retrovirus-related Pol Polyprotein from transposon 412 [Phytophthora megakarya]|uniref:Retrovirus-related Pol Polyprotein from transposon 412 n=1 Tax=Phytophthora megakarya TaxID=4795 RepID=A0A225WNT0_9STRA|nr:Retrovirus-related Pol Polyprotein from transposon 412 [Phytophthora megakarya]
MIRKPDGCIRFCIDYRKLNAITVKYCYPMPLSDDILDVLGNAKFISTMDIASGYWNVPMHLDCISKTAFTSKFGLYEWLVMPFGLCNAVPAFEHQMENEGFPTHLERIRQVLERFRKTGFKLKMKKCHWGRDPVAFLGHLVTPTGNPEKVKTVMNAKKSHDLHTLRAFLSLTSYFRRYIPGFAASAAPLGRLKQKDVAFHWDRDCDTAFLQLQRKLVKPSILVYPDFTKRFKLYVDSSHLAVRVCLMQEMNGRDRAVAYASKIRTGSMGRQD